MSYRLTQEQIDEYINAADLELGPACGDPFSVACADVLHAALSKSWRCFHCDEVFTTPDAARDHFGRMETAQPACTIDAAKYRDMESLTARYREEDTDLHREIAGMHAKYATALLRAEEVGYARGMEALRKESEPILTALLELTCATFHALDNGEEITRGQERDIVHVIQQADYDHVCAALNTLEALPDDKPGYTLGPAGKARWALRNLLGDTE